MSKGETGRDVQCQRAEGARDISIGREEPTAGPSPIEQSSRITGLEARRMVLGVGVEGSEEGGPGLTRAEAHRCQSLPREGGRLNSSPVEPARRSGKPRCEPGLTRALRHADASRCSSTLKPTE